MSQILGDVGPAMAEAYYKIVNGLDEETKALAKDEQDLRLIVLNEMMLSLAMNVRMQVGDDMIRTFIRSIGKQVMAMEIGDVIPRNGWYG